MKRANRTGSIVRLPGNRRRPYAVKVPGRNKYGHVIQKAINYHEKAADAQQALDEYLRNKAAGKAPAADKLSMTVGEVFEGWKAREYRKLGTASIRSYNAAWNKRVSRLAGRKMRDVTLDDWQAVLDEDEDSGKSQSTINNDAALMRALCSYAMERDIIGKDYSQYLDIPSVGAKRPRDALNDIQFAKLSQMAAAGVPWADTALMLCYTGFRVSEFLQLTRFSYHAEHGGYLQGGLKTDAGKNRIVPVHPNIRPYLQTWLEKGGDTIICGKDGKAVSSQQYREYFQKLMEQIGAAGATPHWCRHSCASLLLANGVPMKQIREWLGYSDFSTTANVYAHLDYNSKLSSADAMVNRLSGALQAIK